MGYLLRTSIIRFGSTRVSLYLKYDPSARVQIFHNGNINRKFCLVLLTTQTLALLSAAIAFK